MIETLLQGSWLGTNQGGIAFCAVTLITGETSNGTTRRIVVDPGSAGRREALEAALDRRGLTGTDIDAVLLTHAHWDHMQNLDPFDRAVVLVHPAELNYIKNPHAHDYATPRWTRAALDCYDLREITDDSELMTDVSVLAAPGHSAGTIAVLVETDTTGTTVIAGDAIQHADVARHRRNALVFWDEQEANRSVEKLVNAADTIYPGHDRAFQLSDTGAVHYLEAFDLMISGAVPGQPGLTFQPNPPFQPHISCAPK